MHHGDDRILVCEDDPPSRLGATLTARGYEVRAVTEGEVLEAYASFAPHLVLVGLRESRTGGLRLLRGIRAIPNPAPVLIVTEIDEVATVVSAFHEGAVDCLVRPVDESHLLAVIERTLAARRSNDETSRLRRATVGPDPSPLIGASAQVLRLDEAIAQAATTRATVLITGESGTGKELVATEIHRRGPRAAEPLVKVHCAALAESLLESELFGHERGSFTGAQGRRIGRFEAAHGGTLFLDEIGEISPAVQVKLLRVLQDREFERVGGNTTVRVDTRIIAATNRDLRKLVARGLFREDLFYRLNVFPIETPSLRERVDDIALLAHRFLTRHARTNGRRVRGFTPAALDALVRYPWPGNVRELDNAVEHAVVLTSTGTEVETAALPPEIAPPTPPALPRPAIPGATLAALERYAILRTVEACGGSSAQAARALGISVRKIQYRLHTYSNAPRSGVAAVRSEDEDSAPHREAP